MSRNNIIWFETARQSNASQKRRSKCFEFYCSIIPGWSSDETAAFVVDANEGTFGSVAVGIKSELGFIGTLENILLIPKEWKKKELASELKVQTKKIISIVYDYDQMLFIFQVKKKIKTLFYIVCYFY